MAYFHPLEVIPYPCTVLTNLTTHNFCSCAAALMSQMYKDYKDPDGFLYVTYSGENVFGADASSLDSCSDHSS